MKQRTALMKRWRFLNYVFEVVLLVIFNLGVDSISRITVLLCVIVLCTRLVCWPLKSYPNWITLFLMRNAFSYVSQSSEMQEYIVTAEFISNLTAFSATSYDLYIDHCNHIRTESPFVLWEMLFLTYHTLAKCKNTLWSLNLSPTLPCFPPHPRLMCCVCFLLCI
jgi:hypothetical protein